MKKLFVGLGLLLLAGSPLHAQTTENYSTYVLGLPSASALVGSERIAVIQSGTSKVVTPQQILGIIAGDCTFTSSIVCNKTNGQPFAASATTDATNATNITQGVLASARIPPIALGSVGANGGVVGALGIGNGGCNATSRTSCLNNLMPTPTQNGDVAYWNSAAGQWQSLPGNASGSTATLQETGAGTPSWSTTTFAPLASPSFTGTLNTPTIDIGGSTISAPAAIRTGTNENLLFYNGGSGTLVINATNDGNSANIPLNIYSSLLTTGPLNASKIATTQTLSGTGIAPNLPTTLWPDTVTYSENSIAITDTIGLNQSNPGNVNGLSIVQSYGGSNVNSIRQTLYVEGSLYAPSNSGSNNDYVAGTFFQAASSNDGGTSGNPKGSFFGMNPVAFAYSGATNIQELAAMEVNIGAQSGASIVGKAAISIVQVSADKVQGSTTDAAVWINNQAGAVGWGTGILLDGGSATPFTSSASLIATRGAATVTKGIDFTSYTFTGSAFASPGYSVDGNGNVSALGYRIRNGTSGSTSTSDFNIYWTGSAAQLWIDTVNVGTINLTSDSRIKKDVQDAGPALAEIRRWRPITYTGAAYGIFTANENVRHSFIAQELQSVCADCVVGKGDELRSLDLVPIVAQLTKALQEIDIEVTALKAQTRGISHD